MVAELPAILGPDIKEIEARLGLVAVNLAVRTSDPLAATLKNP